MALAVSCLKLQRAAGLGLPGGPVTKTPCSQCRGPRFHAWPGNQILYAATKDPAQANK